jgi:molybdopterin/thiamine biosynthesis adenylyltransferase
VVELERYARQTMLKGFGMEAQRRLQRARVVVVGLGGLGSSASIYLTAAGAGNLLLVDPDVVQLSDLNRQILYCEGDVGRPKAKSAAESLSRLNPSVSLRGLASALTEENAEDIVGGADVAVDALDSYAARYILNEACVRLGVPMVHGAVEGFDGQVTTVIPGRGPCLRCILPGAPDIRREVPVLGPTPGLIGCIQAMEAIKVITGIGKPLVGRMLIFSGKEMRFEEIEVKRNPGCPVCGRGG